MSFVQIHGISAWLGISTFLFKTIKTFLFLDQELYKNLNYYCQSI